MERFDFVIIGAGPAGEAAAHLARGRRASVAIVDRDLFGGSCPHWGCIPSKSLLNAAAHHAEGGNYSWERASARRDYMINRVNRDYPDDSGHVRDLESAGAMVYRGEGVLDGPGHVLIRHDDVEHHLEAVNVIIAVGSQTKVPPLEGIDTVRTWTNRDATGTRELPKSLVVLGGGPTGVELAQVFARFGVPTSIVQSGRRLIPKDHPRNADAALRALQRDGVRVRLGVRALRARAKAGADGADVIDLDDGSTAEGHAILLAVGRTFPLGNLGLDSIGIDPDDRMALPPDGRLRIADGVYLVGDPAGPELHTHQAHYQGEMAVRMALGDPVSPDYRALPRATYTDPELAFVGLTLEDALDAGHDAFELVADFPTTAKGYSVEATFGHVTIVVDRSSHELVGAAMATPDASAAIHECVLAIKARVPIEVLAETIHAFPSTSRVFNTLFNDAARKLRAEAAERGMSMMMEVPMGAGFRPS
ncbi:MAG TPA: NAD(P)/FAD-dependent oxidoreductase [Candidatus Limnocylindrales bacterium]|jgi:pyruvate/2-oxoglutarate dehydrogenase complex dihydrolipoamide dehydrogenase (E3) component